MNDWNREHERWSDDLAAYLLGGLDAEEAAAFERHAEGCERCRAETRWLAPAVHLLPETAKRVQAPPELRARLMAEVRADAAASPGAEPGDEWRGRLAALRGPISLRPLGALAALVLIVGVMVGYELGNGGSGGGSASTFVAGHAPGVTATVVRRDEGATLRLANVQPLPRQRVLEAWVRREGTVEPIKALFVPDRKGHAQTTIGDMRGVELVMVTTEPPGGSQSPTSTPIVTVPVQ